MSHVHTADWICQKGDIVCISALLIFTGQSLCMSVFPLFDHAVFTDSGDCENDWAFWLAVLLFLVCVFLILFATIIHGFYLLLLLLLPVGCFFTQKACTAL